MKALVLHALSMSDFKAFSEKETRRGKKNSKPAIPTKNQAWRICQCLKYIVVKVTMNVRQGCSNSNMTSIPTVDMWYAHTTKPNNPIAIMAEIIPKFPNASFFSLS